MLLPVTSGGSHSTGSITEQLYEVSTNLDEIIFNEFDQTESKQSRVKSSFQLDGQG